MKKEFPLIAFMLFSLAVYSQTASDYLDMAKSKLKEGNCDSAQRFYNVYKKLSNKTDASVEGQIKKCKNPAGGYAGTVTDICGNKYKYVKIGTQYWMAENMRCNKYDTESECAGYQLPETFCIKGIPYYSRSVYGMLGGDGNGEYYSIENEKFGFEYDWASAVGFTSWNDAKSKSTAFNRHRQGICPNGWHVPSLSEWNLLNKTLGEDAGYKLKSKSGWFRGWNGSDEYLFEAWPISYTYTTHEGKCGCHYEFCSLRAIFWTSTPVSVDKA